MTSEDKSEDALFAIDLDKIQLLLTQCKHCVVQRLQYYHRLNPIFSQIVLFIYCITFLVILPLFCYNLPYSIYWQSWESKEIIKQATIVNHDRFIAANNYVRGLKYQKPNTQPELVIGVITVKRTVGNRALGYLTQVMAQLHTVTTTKNPFSSTQVLICDTFAGPGPHSEADTLHQFFDRRQKYPEPDPSAVIMDSFEKEKQDYQYCLQQTLEMNPKYVLLLEDDAVPQLEMLQVIHRILHRNHIEDRHGHEWSLMKLYYPERWQGYSFEIQYVAELISIGVLTGCLFHLIFHKVNRIHVPRTAYCIQWMPFIIGFLYIVLLCTLVGRQHLIELKRLCLYLYSTKRAPDCCSPGILYPAHQAKTVVDVLNRTVCNHNYPLDMALATHTRQTQLHTYLVEPNLVKHIGMISTLKGVSNAPWDFL